MTFFGLKIEDRKQIFSQIHQIVFYGNGGYNWEQVYNMPIWLRKYTFNELKQHYEKQNKNNNNLPPNTKQNNKQKILRPNIKPTYTTKLPIKK